MKIAASAATLKECIHVFFKYVFQIHFVSLGFVIENELFMIFISIFNVEQERMRIIYTNYLSINIFDNILLLEDKISIYLQLTK